MPKILVWDAPLRVFHWLLALSFLGAFLTEDSERLRDLHIMFGYTMLGLILFRLGWGFAGTRYARLRAFAFGPGRVLAYLRSLLRGQPEHHLGHNPAGSWAIYALLSLGMLTCLSGWLKLQDIGGDAMGAMHEGSANALLGVVLLHLLGVVASSALHRENLLRAMITGYKNGEAGEAIARAHWLIAATLAAMVVLAWAIIPW